MRADSEEEHMSSTEAKRARIRELNDAFRTTLNPQLGKVLLSAGVSELPSDVCMTAIQKTRTFDAFSPDNDPHGEHDFGNFELNGNRFFFKIDYYDAALTSGSEDPSDPSKTTRVLTIMLAQEY
jgi:hypothetical protein